MASDVKRERIMRTIQIVKEAARLGRSVPLAYIQKEFACSKPTAIEAMKAARQFIADEVAGTATTAFDQRGTIIERHLQGGRPLHQAVPLSPRQSNPTAVVESGGPPAPSQVITYGINMAGTLKCSQDRLETQTADLEADIRHVRYFLLGAPAGHRYPGLCRRCGDAEVGQLTLRNKPPELRIGYQDLAALQGRFAQMTKVNTDVVDTYANVSAQFYSWDQLERYINNVKQAIMNVCPGNARAIATELKRLQSHSGGAHGQV